MKYSCFTVFLLCLLAFACGQASMPLEHALMPRDTLVPSLQVVTFNEEGSPMIISGTVYLPDGKTPAKDVILSLWQTDAKGYYIPGGGGAGELHPRIHGRLKTGADGKYVFRSIKPGQYPSHTSPAHVHGHISAPGFPEYPIIYYFESDNLITDKNRKELNSYRGGSPSIIKLFKNASGVLIGHRDFILEYVKSSAETMKLQW